MSVLVYGNGVTGRALKQMFCNVGNNAVIVDDDKTKSEIDIDNVDWNNVDLVVTSPAIMPSGKLIADAKNNGIPVTGELQYCYRLLKCPIISVTGTNGKTTVTQLIHHIFTHCGVNSKLLGNGGVPISSEIANLNEHDVVVHESSSFQLNDCVDFSPNISVLVSLASDHIDYHGSYASYVDAKCNNFIHQKCNGIAVFNADDYNVRELSERSKCYTYYYSVHNKHANCYMDYDDVVVNVGDNRQKIRSKFCYRQFEHNKSDILCAVLVATLYGVPVADCVDAVSSYKFLPHRMQVVAVSNNVTFIDDSKATNVHATLSAVNCLKGKRIALILGGSDKGCNFDELFVKLSADVEYIAVTGDTANKLMNSAHKYGYNNIQYCDTLPLAVEYCYKKLKHNGGVVLMSNACASFDRYSGYAERGRHFCNIVENILGETH